MAPQWLVFDRRLLMAYAASPSSTTGFIARVTTIFPSKNSRHTLAFSRHVVPE
jgi:hypothetical protein